MQEWGSCGEKKCTIIICIFYTANSLVGAGGHVPSVLLPPNGTVIHPPAPVIPIRLCAVLNGVEKVFPEHGVRGVAGKVEGEEAGVGRGKAPVLGFLVQKRGGWCQGGGVNGADPPTSVCTIGSRPHPRVVTTTPCPRSCSGRGGTLRGNTLSRRRGCCCSNTRR